MVQGLGRIWCEGPCGSRFGVRGARFSLYGVGVRLRELVCGVQGSGRRVYGSVVTVQGLVLRSRMSMVQGLAPISSAPHIIMLPSTLKIIEP